MVDTISQYEKIQGEVDAAIHAVVRSGAYINGPAVQEFRHNLALWLGAKHVIPCANGTDALQIALMALDLQPGDEVITPSFTYVATVEVIALLRLKPVFVEVDPDTFNMDAQQVAAAITDRTRVILPVHLFGHAAQMEPILKIAARHGLKVVEDNAQAIGGTYTFGDGTTTKTGVMGDIGCTSFYPSKNLGAYGDGGAICTNDDELAEKLWIICNHGSKVRYYHDLIGVNSRLDSIQAAILNIKLRHLEDYNVARREAANQYDAALAHVTDVATPFRAPYAGHVFHQYTLKVKAGRAMRDGIKAYMDQKGVPTMIYYPVPIHLQPAYLGYGYAAGDFPLSEQLTGEVISLPMHSELNEDQITYITDHLKEAIHAVKSSHIKS
jgi:dTDP-4-amino-4,6-dideoxygalactose transaminase